MTGLPPSLRLEVANVLVVPLGETSPAEIELAVQRHFGGARKLAWFDRADLRRRPLETLARLLRHRYATAVLVAPDLRPVTRLRVTSLILGLVRAERHWRIDLRGEREAWQLGSHLACNLGPIVRHVVACGLAVALGEPVLGAILALIKPRELRLARPGRVLYLRSQLWLGLEGGGSVAHTAGVIGGLESAGVDVQVVSSDRLPGVSAPTHVVSPETWFDGRLRDIEDLAYNAAFFAAALRAAVRIGHARNRSDAQPPRAACRSATRLPAVSRDTKWKLPQNLPAFLQRLARSERSEAGTLANVASFGRTRCAIYQRHTTFNCSGALLSRVLRLPLVLEFNSSEVWKGRYWGGLHLARGAALVERINLRAADRVVVVSRVLADYVHSTGVPKEHILLNPNAVDPTRFSPDIDGTPVRERLGISKSQVVVGFSGTFGNWHGIPTLAEALNRVCEARPDVHWLLIGDGPLRHLVDEAVRVHGLAGRVSQPGLVPHADMPAHLAACDVLVSPHGRQVDGGEFFGSPTKLFEYMAAGRAIVASAVGQIAEVLEDERSALLVPPENPDMLAAAIVRLVDDACLRRRLGNTARAAAVERHTWRQNAERLLASFDA